MIFAPKNPSQLIFIDRDATSIKTNEWRGTWHCTVPGPKENQFFPESYKTIIYLLLKSFIFFLNLLFHNQYEISLDHVLLILSD